jgi:lipid II:glycine glycyltransferase (peptidoglycan interpeptide bridge formation enzyme)
VFSRLNPLFSQGEILQGLGEVSFVGNTVSIPLLDSLEMQWAQFRASHRQRIRKLQKHGIQCEEDRTGEYLEQFSEIYLQTMERLNASSYYRFGFPYFKELFRALRDRVHLFVAKAEEKVIAGALFFECGGIVQYHLSGMSNESLKVGAIKLVIDTARRWASAKGFEYLHLGGGVGAGEDTLFHFKAGFSQQRHDFCCWKWVVNEAAYSKIVHSVREHQRLAGLRPSSPNYFPAYRAGTVPLEDLQ